VLCVTHDKYKLKWLKQYIKLKVLSTREFKGVKFYLYKMGRLYTITQDERTYVETFFLKYFNEFKKVDAKVKDLKHILMYTDPHFRKLIKKILKIKAFKNYSLDLHPGQFAVDNKGKIFLLEFFHHKKTELQAKSLDNLSIKLK
jgi:hypothetical protein